jgi:hypothetical protein
MFIIIDLEEQSPPITFHTLSSSPKRGIEKQRVVGDSEM